MVRQSLALTSCKLFLDDGNALKTRLNHLPGTKQPGGQSLISLEEVQKHKSKEDCWVIIEVGAAVRLPTNR